MAEDGVRLEAFRQPSLRLQQLLEIGRERKHSGLAGLRRAGVEPNFAGCKVDLMPAEREHLAFYPPAGGLHEGDDVAEFRFEPIAELHEVWILDETLSWLLRLLQAQERRNVDDLVVLLGERKHPAQHRRLAVNQRVRR